MSLVFSSSSSEAGGDRFEGAASPDDARDRRELTNRYPIQMRMRDTAMSSAMAPTPKPLAESTGSVSSATARI